MILVIIIGLRDETMLQRALGSGWGIVVPGVIVAVLMLADLSANAWRMVIVLGLLLTPVMLYHKRLRHFILLPSGVALVGAMMLILLNLKMMM
ncbi:DUF1435 domain-containing protein [Kosakonia pseudosacchari]|uniref:DUF1435 domain-containing protein n=1 Tax=Kosakonia pseudosacchari TaxID=1646340 RepID=UPI0022F07C7A|nr:DUF1435 domain-containing protein [Kosakonia pseudosacchari]WBU48747.1 DUF1435 domain-containing protein [Kosakonia pseudosacchari]